METVDPEITVTCKDLGAVKKVFQLALLCTKRRPIDRPTMNEVRRVLGSLVPPMTPTTHSITAEGEQARSFTFFHAKVDQPKHRSSTCPTPI